MNTLFLHGIQLSAMIGVFEWERHQPQTLILDLDLSLPNNKAGLSDDLADTVNYADLVAEVRTFAAQMRLKCFKRIFSAVGFHNPP